MAWWGTQKASPSETNGELGAYQQRLWTRDQSHTAWAKQQGFRRGAVSGRKAHYEQIYLSRHLPLPSARGSRAEALSPTPDRSSQLCREAAQREGWGPGHPNPPAHTGKGHVLLGRRRASCQRRGTWHNPVVFYSLIPVRVSALWWQDAATQS